jgi:HMG (high mobility group) box
MPPEEKENWEKKARKDKARYEVEKAMYKGPWKVQANKRTPKDPTAPKRPMSAFLAFSNKRRAALKRENPDATNADLSKMLSITWKEIPDEIRKKYMDEEAQLRATYKVEVAKWRKKIAEEKKLERNEREAVAMQTAEARAKEPQGQMMNTSNMNNLVAANNARNNQFNNGPIPNQGSNMIGAMGGMPGQVPQQPSQQDMNGGMPGGGYGNPYGMSGSQLGQLGNFGMPGGVGGGPDAAQYASLMAGGNPFAAQSFMSNAPSSQQQLLSQLFGACHRWIIFCHSKCQILATNSHLHILSLLFVS